MPERKIDTTPAKVTAYPVYLTYFALLFFINNAATATIPNPKKIMYHTTTLENISKYFLSLPSFIAFKSIPNINCINPRPNDIPKTNKGPFPSVGLNTAILALLNHFDTGNPKYPPNIIPHIIVDIPPIPIINNN